MLQHNKKYVGSALGGEVGGFKTLACGKKTTRQCSVQISVGCFLNVIDLEVLWLFQNRMTKRFFFSNLHDRGGPNNVSNKLVKVRGV